MKIYSVYAKTNELQEIDDIALVSQRFSMFAAILKVVWAIFKGMWVLAFVLFVISVLLAVLKNATILDNASFIAIHVGFAAIVGFNAHD